MDRLDRKDLWSLEEYSGRRDTFRAEVMEHKKSRQVALGDHARLFFEDQLTIRYQVQEMLRIEKIFEAAGVQEELDAYNPLIPDGSNFKATFMLEYGDESERQRRLQQLVGVERDIYIKVDWFEPLHPIADEDLQRQNDGKTSSVHFLRFEVPQDVRDAIKSGSSISIGVEHPQLTVTATQIESNVRDSLVDDLN
jgi:hypothetical protein|tara:strand:+ start:1483 stop:2067 length:585 start_codon:yes stop_codon:yes gene_type:complete